jgi:ABC-2 type transport system permease protein
VVAKLAALTIGLLLALTLLPVLLLFLGRVLAAEDLVGALGDEIGFLPAILGSGLLHAVVLASIGLAISSVAGRRAYAAAAILAIFLVGSVMSGTSTSSGGGLQDDRPVRLSRLAILDGTREWLFGESVAGSPVSAADVPLPCTAWPPRSSWP